MSIIEQVLAIIGAISTLATAIAPLFPKGSKTGAAIAKVGVDLKGHNTQSMEWVDTGRGKKLVKKSVQPEDRI